MKIEHTFTGEYAVAVAVDRDKRFMSLIAKSGNVYPKEVEVRLTKDELRQLVFTLLLALESM